MHAYKKWLERGKKIHSSAKYINFCGIIHSIAYKILLKRKERDFLVTMVVAGLGRSSEKSRGNVRE